MKEIIRQWLEEEIEDLCDCWVGIDNEELNEELEYAMRIR